MTDTLDTLPTYEARVTLGEMIIGIIAFTFAVGFPIFYILYIGGP
jgi:hypothetical protein